MKKVFKDVFGKTIRNVLRNGFGKVNRLLSKLKVGLVLLGQAGFLACITIFAVMPTGCKLEEDDSEILSGDHSAPVIEDVKVVDENTVEIEFSEPVKVETESVTEVGGNDNEDAVSEMPEAKDTVAESESESKDSKDTVVVDEEVSGTENKNESSQEVINEKEVVQKDEELTPSENTDNVLNENPSGEDSSVSEKDDVESDEATEVILEVEKETEKTEEISYSEDGTKVIITLPEETEVGKDYIISGSVEDEKGNTLTFAIPFAGYNGNLPKIVMTEIQTESLGQSATEKKNGTYRNEFVEFLALSDGNLAGFELVSAYDGEERKFVFPSCDVKAGEIFVVHLRSRGEGCISELGDDLDVAFGGYAKNGIRDLWCDSEVTALGNDTDVIFLRNSADGSIWDGVIFRSEKVSEWNEKFMDSVEMLVQIGFYEDGSVESATLTEGMTASKTLSRANAYALLQRVLRGEDIVYPISVSGEDWVVTAVSSGEVKE